MRRHDKSKNLSRVVLVFLGRNAYMLRPWEMHEESIQVFLIGYHLLFSLKLQQIFDVAHLWQVIIWRRYVNLVKNSLVIENIKLSASCWCNNLGREFSCIFLGSRSILRSNLELVAIDASATRKKIMMFLIIKQFFSQVYININYRLSLSSGE